MKLKDLLQILYGYNEIELYDSNRQYLGSYYEGVNIKEECQNQQILSIWVNDHGRLELVLLKN